MTQPVVIDPALRDVTTMQTASGRAWPLLDPDPAHVHWPDVAEQLAKANCFVGATPGRAYSVAEHCCRVADALDPEARPYGLLHRANEAFIGPLATPLLQALAALGAGGAMARIVERHDRALHHAAGLAFPVPAAVAAAVADADHRLFATERRDLLAPSRTVWKHPLPAPLRHVIKPWPWAKAADEWLARLQRLCPATDRHQPHNAAALSATGGPDR